MVTWSFSNNCQKTHQHLFVEQVEVCCIPTSSLYLTNRQVCVCVCGQPVSFGTSGSGCVPWQLVFLFGRRESELVSWRDFRIILFINRSKRTPAQKPQYSSSCRGRLKAHSTYSVFERIGEVNGIIHVNFVATFRQSKG